jgi:hypothetical protein
MARQRSHSIEFKRQVAQEFIAAGRLRATSNAVGRQGFQADTNAGRGVRATVEMSPRLNGEGSQNCSAKRRMPQGPSCPPAAPDVEARDLALAFPPA